MRAQQPAAIALILLGLMISSAWKGSGQEPMSEAEIQKKAATADSYYKGQNFIAALPLYEDLHNRVPESNVYRERLAMALIGSASGQTQEQQKAMIERAHKLLLDAKAAGDNSNLLQVMLEKLEEAEAMPLARGPESPGADSFRLAEKAFASGDLAGSVKLYEEAAKADPKLYEAPLYAGDAEFKQGHYPEANQWYARAVSIDPDRDTAYRYWGDSLMKQGDSTRAEDKFIDAVIAQPYTRAPRIGLKQWADPTGVRLMPPPISLPVPPVSDEKGHTNITIDASNLGSPMSPALLAYSMQAALWRSEMFKKSFPNEPKYRHSLAEQAESIRVALSVLKEQNVAADKLDATWKTLMDLDRDGMLECWILLDHTDQGIAQDYVTYRASHRELMHAYIAKYDVHKN